MPKRTTDDPVLDFMGREITVGATVVYPVHRKSSMWLEKIKVASVGSDIEPFVTGYNSAGRKITIRNVANLVIVERMEESPRAD